MLGGGVFRLFMVVFGGVFAGGLGDISLGVLDYCSWCPFVVWSVEMAGWRFFLSPYSFLYFAFDKEF